MLMVKKCSLSLINLFKSIYIDDDANIAIGEKLSK